MAVAERMSSDTLTVLSIAPGASIQDLGRPGFQRYGVSESGVMDRMSAAHGAALLRQSISHPVIELSGGAAQFVLQGRTAQFAVTGADARILLDDTPVAFGSSFALVANQRISIHPKPGSVYTYLHVRGGFEVPQVMGSASTHPRAGFGGVNGRFLQAQDAVAIATAAPMPEVLCLNDVAAGHPHEIRIVWGAQAERFSDDIRARFLRSEFIVSSARDRMGIRLTCEDTSGFAAAGGLSGISDAVIAGDVQIGGDGMATVLLADRQPTGGYPRIGTVITADLDRMAQLPTGATFRFVLVTVEEAVQALRAYRVALDRLPERVRPMYRNPQQMHDLLSYNLIDGVINAKSS